MFFVAKNTAIRYRSNIKWCRLIWATLALESYVVFGICYWF